MPVTEDAPMAPMMDAPVNAPTDAAWNLPGQPAGRIPRSQFCPPPCRRKGCSWRATVATTSLAPAKQASGVQVCAVATAPGRSCTAQALTGSAQRPETTSALRSEGRAEGRGRKWRSACGDGVVWRERSSGNGSSAGTFLAMPMGQRCRSGRPERMASWCRRGVPDGLCRQDRVCRLPPKLGTVWDSLRTAGRMTKLVASGRL